MAGLLAAAINGRLTKMVKDNNRDTRFFSFQHQSSLVNKK